MSCLIPRGLGLKTLIKLSYRNHMPTNLRQFECEHVSATEAGEGFQVLFQKVPESDEGYVLVQRHFEFPDREECYVESNDPDFSGHFRIRDAYLSRNRFRMAFGRSPVREIAVSFDATDSVSTEVKRVLQIMIPALVISYRDSSYPCGQSGSAGTSGNGLYVARREKVRVFR